MALTFPASPVDGQVFNEWVWDATNSKWAWNANPAFLDSVQYLVIAGGGSGGSSYTSNRGSGGGGAGGYRSAVDGENSGGGASEEFFGIEFNQSFTVTIGAGGPSPIADLRFGNQGGNSVFASILSIGEKLLSTCVAPKLS